MKVYDRIEKKDLDLTTAELIDLMVIKNRQVDLTHTDHRGWKAIHPQLFHGWPGAE